MRTHKNSSRWKRPSSKGSQDRVRTTRIERLETRLALHDGADGPWLDHLLDDNAVLDETAANPPQATPLAAAQASIADPAVVGQWGTLQNWPIEWINTVMLPTGKVLGYDRTLNLRLWDPATNTFTSPASPGYNFFCTGTSLLSDGSVLMTGGAVVDTVGLPYAAIYNPFTDTWTQMGNMNAGRWYPSTTTLANGDALVLSGDTNGNVTDPLPQVYDSTTGTWRDLTGAVQSLPFYPRTFSAPNGDAFVAGPQPLSEYIDTTGLGQIIPVANRVVPDRNFGSAVMYAPGKVLYVGGGSPAVASAEVIDLNQPNPSWRSIAPMAFARRNCNATLLPDGEVLVIGGNTGSGTYDGNDIMAAEIWNPQTEQFTTLGNMSDIRWYHSVALLLPDGRVLSTSGDLHLTGQVYSPPYLFQGAQPTITSAPATVQYGDNFFVGTPDAANITDVRWVRLGSATHAQNWDQYAQSAAFTKTATGVNVAAPPSPDSSPPGYYYLSILKGGVPSVAKIIKVGTALPTLSVADTSVAEGSLGNTVNAVFTVSLSLSSAKIVTVAYATANGTALAGQDYTAKTGVLTFAPLVTSQTITVPILSDGTAEPNETFSVNLSAPVGATLAKGQGQGLIRDFSALPVLQIQGATVVKADAVTTNANFVVTLSAPPTTTPVNVAYTTVDGTATAPHDYIAQTGTLTFNPGVTQQTIVVGVAGNTTDEPNDTFVVKLLTPNGATLDIGQAQGLIYNQAPPAAANLPLNATINEPAPGTTANLVLTATLSAPSGKTIVLPWTTAGDGTAVANTNFVAQLGRVTFAPGATTATLTVTILNDGVKEPNEGFSVQMQSELQNAVYGNRYAFCFINNIDAVPAISLSNASVVEGNSATTPEIFTATLTAPMAQAVTVAYQTSAGTATANVDYNQAAGVITFAPGTTTQTITVMVNGDTAKESNETYNLALSNPAGAMLDIDKAVGTIVDDDGAPAPAAPANLTGVPGFGLIALSWQASAGAASYRIYRGTNDNGEGTTPIATGIVGTAFTDTGLVNGTVYYYRVTAVSGPQAGTSYYEGSPSSEFAIAPTAYDFSQGFIGSSSDPTVQSSAYLPNSYPVLSLNGLNVEDVRSFGAGLQLTDGGSNQTDSAFTLNPVNVTRFTTQFTFQIAPSLLYTYALADGMTFTIQGVGPNVLGVSGGGLGYTGIGQSIAVKFDLFNSSGEGSNSTGLYTNGAQPTSINSINLDGTGIDLHSTHPFNVAMTYDGATLQVTITDSVTQAAATQSYTVNIPAIVGGNTAYVGFTAGTGGLSAMQTVQTWRFTPAPVAPTNLLVTSASNTPVSLSWTNTDPNATATIIERKTGAAGTYAQIGTTTSPTANTYLDLTAAGGTTYFYRVRASNNGSTSLASNEVNVTTVAVPAINFPNGFAGAAGQFSFNGTTAKIAGTNLQLTDGGALQADSIFALAPVGVTHFTSQFNFQTLAGTTPTADGMTFTIQGAGLAALGALGGGLGFAGIANSVAVKFDLFDNAGEGPDSTGLYTNGAEPNAINAINLVGSGIDLHRGDVFNVGMTYDGVTLLVTITDTVTQAHATQSYTVNIPAILGANTAYVGFTGGTGGLTAVQNVLNWTYTLTQTLGAPANLLVSSVSSTQVDLSWTNTDPNSTAVFVERKTGAAGTYAQIGMTTTPTANTYSDSTVVAGTTYYYRVRATSNGGTSLYSNEISATASATPPVVNFPNGFSGAAGQFSFNGPTAKIAGTSLQLTDGGVTEAASIFALTPLTVTAFSTQFNIQLINPLGDGMTFTIQGAGPTALGASGGALGYAGIAQSVAVKFDLFDNAGEGPNSTGMYTNGAQPNAINSVNLTGTGLDLHSGDVFNVSMVYDGITLLVTITDTVTQAAHATQSYTVNIPAIVGANAAYVGFTGGTGGTTAVQNVLNWTYTVTPTVGIPANLQITSASDTQVGLNWTNTDPNSTAVLVERKTGAAGTYAQIGMTAAPTANTFTDQTVVAGTTYYYRVRATSNGNASAYSNEVTATTSATTPVVNLPNGFAGAAGQFSFNGPTAKIVGVNLQLTDGGAVEAASAFEVAPVDVTHFTTQFNFQTLAGTNPTADGMTFTIQGIGPAALGGSGGSLGYAGIANSVAVKFDLFDNGGEGPDSTGLYTNGAQPNAINSVDLSATGVDLHSGDVFNVSMAYDGTTLLVTITDTVTQAKANQSYTVNIPAIVGSNMAYVGFTGGTGGLTAVQNVLNWTLVADRPADLQISNTDGQTTAVPGAPITYTIVVTNAGPRDVTGAGVADALPATLSGASFTAVATGGATGFTPIANGNISDTVNLPAGSTITYTVQATLNSGATGTLSNSATVSAPAGVTDTNPVNNAATDTDSVTALPAPTITGHYLFYNNSKYDNNTAGASPSDDNAMATDKVSYLPGSGPATFVNLSSYSLGINGIMIDISGSHPNIGSGDFVFRVGNNNSPNAWAIAPNPASITVRAGAGDNGSDRVEVIWNDGAIQQQWLEGTVLTTANTGLTTNDVFFFGSEIADTGVSNTAMIAKVTSLDVSGVQTHGASAKANIPDINLYDFNRDGQVNSLDVSAAQTHGTSNKTALQLIDVADTGPFAPVTTPGTGIGDSGVAVALASALASPSVAAPASPAWIVNRLSHIDSNQGPVAKYLEHLANDGRAQSQEILAEADQMSDALGLDDHLLDSLLTNLGLE